KIRMTDEGGHQIELSEAVPDHRAAAVHALDWLGQQGIAAVDAVAHRIVHGGEQVTEPALVTKPIISALDKSSQFAPLPNPPALSVLRAVGQRLHGIPAVIVTDTGFHSTIPPAARSYAIPGSLADRYGIRRFGFHGIGHAWMMERCAAIRGAAPGKLNL